MVSRSCGATAKASGSLIAKNPRKRRHVAGKPHRLYDDLEICPDGGLDCVVDPLALKHSVGNQLARAQSRQQFANCPLFGAHLPDLMLLTAVLVR
jgi:hypothetical protein